MSMSIITILLPIFFVFGVGYIAQRFLKLETKVLSNLALYVLVPFLVFRTFYEQKSIHPMDISPSTCSDFVSH